MKTLKKIGFLFLLAFAATSVLTSCDGTDDVATGPSLTFDPDYTFEDRTATPGENIRIDVVITSEERIEDLSMVVTNGANEDEVYLLEDINEKQYTGTISRAANATVGAVETWTVIVTDKKGGSTQKSIVITTEGESPDLSQVSDQKFFNIIGKQHGAFDLVSSATVAASSASTTKDIVDQTVDGTDFGSWGTLNGTEFIRTTTAGTFLSYEKLSDIEDAWAKEIAKKSSTVDDVQVGDLILVKSGQVGNPMFVIAVTAVTETTTPGNNEDSYTFNYKGVF